MTSPLIIGAGPAGQSAALWLHALGVKAHWVEAAPCLGGTLCRIHHPIQNLPGVAPADGTAWAKALEDQRKDLAIPLHVGLRVAHLDLLNRSAAPFPKPFTHVVLATGTRPRLPVLPDPWSAASLLDRGLYLSTHRWGAAFKGQPVGILGAGDGAFEGALILRKQGAQTVHIIHRGHTLRARPAFIEAVRQDHAVHVHLGAVIRRLEGDPATQTLRGALIDTSKGPQTLAISGIFAKLGVEPALPPLDAASAAALALDPDGYPITDPRCRTSIPWVFAIGDLRRARPHTIASAQGDGAIAADAIAQHLSSA